MSLSKRIARHLSSKPLQRCLATQAQSSSTNTPPTPIRYNPQHNRTTSSRDRARDESHSRNRQGPPPQIPNTKIIHCRIHGITASNKDISRILGPSFPEPVDYVLRRHRREQITYITLEFSSAVDGGRARRVLSQTWLNGKRIETNPVVGTRLPAKYEPLHTSPQSGPGKVVSIEGMPYSCNEDRLREALAGYQLVDNQDFQFHLVARLRDISVWLIRLTSEDEAQRLVRNINGTLYRFRQAGALMPIKAEIFF